jgi:nucleotide-binding universal stress UspA family protein
MAYKTIMVCLNEIARLPELIAVAKGLGAQFNAHISGLFVIPGIEVYPSSAYAAGPGFYEGNRKYYHDKLPKVRLEFEAAMKKEGLSFDFHEVDSDFPQIVHDVIEQSRSVDLVVVSVPSERSVMGVEFDFVEKLVLSASRPVLVLPFNGEAWPDMDEMILGWDDSREASRAAFDAVPLLKIAKRVHVVTVDPEGPGTVPGAAIAESLDRHGIKAKTLTISSDGMGVGETLLRTAKDQGAGLIVMGAYGHYRFTEFIFGGATRHLVRNLDRPILMSH